MSFLPIAILAYALAAGSIVADKILLKKSVSDPAVFTFFVNILQFAVILLIPFGFTFQWNTATYLAIASGVVSVLALYTFFVSLKYNEAAVTGPLVGAFNPLSALLIEGLFLGQLLTSTQYMAIAVLIVGTIVFTHDQWISELRLNHRFVWIVASGILFGIAYVLLRQVFLETTFVNGLVISRIAAAIFAATFLILPGVRRQIFSPNSKSPIVSHSALALTIGAQAMGGASGLLISFGITLASASLVNSLFGVQYLVILAAALVFAKKYPHLLEELSRKVITQKIIGVTIISVGLYLLAR